MILLFYVKALEKAWLDFLAVLPWLAIVCAIIAVALYHKTQH